MQKPDVSQITDKHHRIFCEPGYSASPSYRKFWKDLAAGIKQTGEFKRKRKDGSDIWINATYTPVRDAAGEILKVIKVAADITDMVTARQIGEHVQDAVNTGWAAIEFEPDGTIINANSNFLKALGYSLDEIAGQHHRIFCDAAYVASPEYARFWKDLASGSTNSGEFKRFTKNGDEIWINATYTPVKDEDGKVVKVIKIANDITEMVLARTKGENIKSAVDSGWAYIEFQPDGTIIEANDNIR